MNLNNFNKYNSIIDQQLERAIESKTTDLLAAQSIQTHLRVLLTTGEFSESNVLGYAATLLVRLSRLTYGQKQAAEEMPAFTELEEL